MATFIFTVWDRTVSYITVLPVRLSRTCPHRFSRLLRVNCIRRRHCFSRLVPPPLWCMQNRDLRETTTIRVTLCQVVATWRAARDTTTARAAFSLVSLSFRGRLHVESEVCSREQETVFDWTRSKNHLGSSWLLIATVMNEEWLSFVLFLVGKFRL